MSVGVAVAVVVAIVGVALTIAFAILVRHYVSAKAGTVKSTAPPMRKYTVDRGRLILTGPGNMSNPGGRSKSSSARPSYQFIRVHDSSPQMQHRPFAPYPSPEPFQPPVSIDLETGRATTGRPFSPPNIPSLGVYMATIHESADICMSARPPRPPSIFRWSTASTSSAMSSDSGHLNACLPAPPRSLLPSVRSQPSSDGSLKAKSSGRTFFDMSSSVESIQSQPRAPMFPRPAYLSPLGPSRTHSPLSSPLGPSRAQSPRSSPRLASRYIDRGASSEDTARPFALRTAVY